MKFLPVEWYDTIPSTNTLLEEKIARKEPVPSGIIVSARQQTAGKGRYSRTWITGKNKNLAFSYLMQVTCEPKHHPSLAMACAVAVAKQLNKMGVNAITKWPNDVLVKNKKICGILSKQIPKPQQDGFYVIIGCGINVNMADEEANLIDKPATSILIETGITHEIDTLLPEFLHEIQQVNNQWEENHFQTIQQEWEQNHKPIGTLMTMSENGSSVNGYLSGFGKYGELLLRDAEGNQHTIVQGDVFYE